MNTFNDYITKFLKDAEANLYDMPYQDFTDKIDDLAEEYADDILNDHGLPLHDNEGYVFQDGTSLTGQDIANTIQEAIAKGLKNLFYI